MRRVKFTKGGIYHIFNRGVDKRNIFRSDGDMWRFVQDLYLFNDKKVSTSSLLQIRHKDGGLNFRTLNDFLSKNKYERKPLVKIMADCLMPNHFHLILEEIEDGGISKFMHKLGTGYTHYFNKKYKREGNFFQGTFKAVLINEDLYLQYLLIYLNVINPAGLIKPGIKREGIKINDIDGVMRFAENYPWSTHQDYLRKRDSIVIDKGELHRFFQGPVKYRQFTKDILLTKKLDIINDLFLE